MKAINIILDESRQRDGKSSEVLFVEIENDEGKSIKIGERSDIDGLTRLRITREDMGN